MDCDSLPRNDPTRITYAVIDGKPTLGNIKYAPVLCFDVEKINHSVGSESPERRDLLRVSAVVVGQNATTMKLELLESLDVPFPADLSHGSPECIAEFWTKTPETNQMFERLLRDGDEASVGSSKDPRKIWIISALRVVNWFDEILEKYRGLEMCRLVDNPYDVAVVNRLLSLFPNRSMRDARVDLVAHQLEEVNGLDPRYHGWTLRDTLPYVSPGDRGWHVDYDRNPDGTYSYSNNALVVSSYYNGIRGCDDRVWNSNEFLMKKYWLTNLAAFECHRTDIPIPERIKHDHHSLNDAAFETMQYMLIRHARCAEAERTMAVDSALLLGIKRMQQQIRMLTDTLASLQTPRMEGDTRNNPQQQNQTSVLCNLPNTEPEPSLWFRHHSEEGGTERVIRGPFMSFSAVSNDIHTAGSNLNDTGIVQAPNMKTALQRAGYQLLQTGLAVPYFLHVQYGEEEHIVIGPYSSLAKAERKRSKMRDDFQVMIFRAPTMADALIAAGDGMDDEQ